MKESKMTEEFIFKHNFKKEFLNANKQEIT